MPQEKAHKQGTSSLPVFKDDSYGMQNRFLHTRLISPSKTSGCSLACSCSTVRANTASTELSNTLLCHSSHISGHYKENPLSSFTGYCANCVYYSGPALSFDEIIFNCTIFFALLMPYHSSIMIMNSSMLPFKCIDCNSQSGNNICQYLVWLQQSALRQHWYGDFLVKQGSILYPVGNLGWVVNAVLMLLHSARPW